MSMRKLDQATALQLAEIAQVPPEKHRNFVPILLSGYSGFVIPLATPIADPSEKISEDQRKAIGRVERAAERLAHALSQLDPETREHFRAWHSRTPSFVKAVREASKLFHADAWRMWSAKEDPPAQPLNRKRGRPSTRDDDGTALVDHFMFSVLEWVEAYGGRLTLSGGDKGTLLEFAEVLKPCLPPHWRHHLSPGKLRYLRGLISKMRK
jgi:hypothetical protein